MTLKTTLFATILISTALLAGCANEINTHGHVVSERQIKSLRLGVDDKQTVQTRLGSPSTTGTFFDNRWYYMTEKVLNKPLNPNLLQQRQVIVVEFNEEEKVSKIWELSQNDGADINPSTRVTPTQGQSLGIVDQLLQNLGQGF